RLQQPACLYSQRTVWRRAQAIAKRQPQVLENGSSDLELAYTLLPVVSQDQRDLVNYRIAVTKLEEQFNHAGKASLFDDPLAPMVDRSSQEICAIGAVAASEIANPLDREDRAEDLGRSSRKQASILRGSAV